MNLSKQQATDMAPNDHIYIGSWDNHYHYQRGNYSSGFYVMSLLDEDMTKENIALMVKLNMTRNCKLK